MGVDPENGPDVLVVLPKGVDVDALPNGDFVAEVDVLVAPKGGAGGATGVLPNVDDGIDDALDMNGEGVGVGVVAPKAVLVLPWFEFELEFWSKGFGTLYFFANFANNSLSCPLYFCNVLSTSPAFEALCVV